jgi:hypothetical protein
MEALDSVSTLQSIILLTKRSVLIQSHDSDLCTSDQTKSVSDASSPREITQSGASHHQHVDYRTGARLLCFKDGKSGSHESQQASTYGGEHQYKNWWMSTREPVPAGAVSTSACTYTGNLASRVHWSVCRRDLLGTTVYVTGARSTGARPESSIAWAILGQLCPSDWPLTVLRSWRRRA